MIEGPVGEIETPHHPEDQGEADREQRVGRADEDAVEGVLDEVDRSPVDHHGVCRPGDEEGSSLQTSVPR